MKISYSVFLLLFIVNFCYANVWQGDYLIQSQADADAFRNICNCTSINGNLIITGNDVNHVDSLYAVIDVNGGIEISNTSQFNNFYGLRHILKIKFDLKITNNQFTTIEGFDRLKSIGGEFEIVENKNLEKIEGFENLKDVEKSILIKYNSKLKQFSVFKTLEHCGGFRIKENDSLELIESLDNLTKIDHFSIWRNKNLKQIIGFNKIDTINWSIQIFENSRLEKIQGFEKLKKIGLNVQIDSNDRLLSICGFEQLDDVSGGFEVWLSSSIVNESYFENLATVGNYFTSNIAHFEKLHSVGTYQLTDDRYNTDTLTGFSGLKKINELVITNNVNLKHINGFEDLEQVLQFSISNNPNLKHIEDFNQLEFVGLSSDDLFSIVGNASLQIINGFENLKKINGEFDISSNYNLTNISAFNQLIEITGNCKLKLSSFLIDKSNFNNLQNIGGVLFTNATNFKTLESVNSLVVAYDFLGHDTLTGFSTLKQAGHIQINKNETLKHIEAFPELETVSKSILIMDNKILTTISGFDKIHTIKEDLNISNNPNLIHLTELNSLSKAISITSNQNLQKISGFSSLIKVGHINANIGYIQIVGNNSLLSVEGFNQLSSLSLLRINGRNLRKLEAFTNLKILNTFNLNANVQLRSIDNFSKIGFIADQLVLKNNLQLKDCCLVNCWLNQGVVDESIINFGNNGMDCFTLQSIKNTCEESSCPTNEQSLSDLNTNNPVIEQLQFSFLVFEDQSIRYKIYNINKQLIREGSVLGYKGFNSKTIDLPSVENGFYFLQIGDKESKEVVKFLKL